MHPNVSPSLKPRIGLIGCGNRGVRCFGALLKQHKNAELTALADTNSLRLQSAAEVLQHDGPSYTSVEAMLSEELLHGVVITTPDYLHSDHILMAMQAGIKHVLVDKPLATTTAGCLRVIKALQECSASGQPAQVAIGFNMRHKPLIARIKEIIDSGEIGELMLIENREFYDGGRTYMGRWNRKYEYSGGLWIHKGSHDFDVFNWWNSAGTPTRVFASAGINALRPDKIPFSLEANTPVGPTCTSCEYSAVCPDYSPPVGGQNLFNSQTAQADGYVQDLCQYLSNKDVHDNGIALVEYDNNVRASHMECFVCGFDDRLYTVVGDRGCLMASTGDPTRIEIRPRWGASRIVDVPPPPEGSHGGADPLLVDNFIEGIRGVDAHSSTVRDGIRAIAVGDAAEISWRQRRAVEINELVNLRECNL